MDLDFHVSAGRTSATSRGAPVMNLEYFSLLHLLDVHRVTKTSNMYGGAEYNHWLLDLKYVYRLEPKRTRNMPQIPLTVAGFPQI